MELEIGMYVRTDKGIAKYLGLGRDVLKHETNKNTYEHYYNQHIFDECIFNVGHDYGDTLTYDEFNNIDKLGKVKETITDLIEVGDYVNGLRVDAIENNKLLNSNSYDGWLCNIDIDEKIAIVTKEQFSQMEYRIGD